ncbi:MAG: hypothetical protein KC431_06220, partial [Myxococcales bacterium]|nr:hypothetical protein [Myxococcales bacterium]
TAGLLEIGVIDGDALALERDAWVQGIGRGQPIELRNIRSGTPMHLLGLRTGDRVQAILTYGERDGEQELLERVELVLERRGRPVHLVYELV